MAKNTRRLMIFDWSKSDINVSATPPDPMFFNDEDIFFVASFTEDIFGIY